MRHIRTYPRGAGKDAFTVYHDHTAYEGRGIFRVILGGQRIGAQVSYPSAEDCERMLDTATPGARLGTNREARRRLEQASIGRIRGARTISLMGRRGRKASVA